MAVQFSQEVFDKICDMIADGKSLRAICKSDDMPSQVTVFAWLRKNEELAKQYARAREDQADAIFDECLEIADTQVAKEIIEPEHIQRAKLRIDTRKWMAGKLRPKKYGEKLELGGSGDDGAILVQQITRKIVKPDN